MAAPREADSASQRRPQTPPLGAADTPWGEDADGAHDGDTPWLMSYVDFMTVLVALFVFLYAFEKARVNDEPAPAEQEAAVVAAPAEPAADEPITTTVASAPPTMETAAATPAAAEAPAKEPVVATPPPAAATPVTAVPPVADTTAQAAAPTASEPAETEQPSATEPATTNMSAEAAAPVATNLAPASSVPPAPAIESSPVVPQSAPAQTDPLAALAPLADRIVVKQDAQKLLIEINDAVLFDPASAELKNRGKTLLDELLPTLLQHAGPITVEGHTDNRPIATVRYPSNWELSAARASTVTRQLVGAGLPAERIRPVGHADTQPRASNASAEGRAQNRRVVIVLHKEQAG